MPARQELLRLGLAKLVSARSAAALGGVALNASSSGQFAFLARQSVGTSTPFGSLGLLIRRHYADWPAHTLMAMPSLSPTMTQGNIAKWTKKEGDAIAPGHVIAELETDKATMEWESQEEGFIAKILAPAGTKDIAVGTPVAVLVSEAADVAAFKNFKAEGAPAAAPATAPTPSPAPAAPTPPPAPTPAAPKPAAVPASTAKPAAAAGGSAKATPYAKKLAAEAGVPLQGIVGTGPGGRILADDVLKAKAAGHAAPAAAPSFAPAAAAAGTFVDIPHSQIKRITAARLLESKQTIPHYYLTMEVNVEALLDLRAQINKAQEKAGIKLSVNDFVVKAAALALKQVPGVNSQWNADFTRQFNNVDISVAVQTPVGLQVPIVKDADKKGLGGISSEVKALAAKAKEGKLQPSEFIGGTFTISNLGMLGVKQFAAIVNPPQAAILAVGAVHKKVAAKAHTYVETHVMNVTLSCDHRVIDGAMGAEWLKVFKSNIETPFNMLL